MSSNGRRDLCASAARISFTRIMIAAMQVLKCQRPLKSSVIFAMVWWSVRRSLASAGELVFPEEKADPPPAAKDDNSAPWAGRPAAKDDNSNPWAGADAGVGRDDRFAMDGANCGEAMHAGEETGDAGDAFFLPLEIAVRAVRRRARTCAWRRHRTFRSSLSGATTLPLFFDIFAPSLMTMPWVKRRVTGSEFETKREVAHHFGPEARVDEVQDRVLDAADVLVDGEPVVDFLSRVEMEQRSVVCASA